MTLPAPSSSWTVLPSGAVRPAHWRDPRYVTRPPRMLRCAWCSISFRGYRGKVYCSDPCKKLKARADARVA